MVLVVYGSLYPWRFESPHLDANPLWILFHSWPGQPFTSFLRDAIVNVALYVPLGFTAHLVFKKGGVPGLGIYGPVLLGLALSISIELIQLLEPARTSSMIDVANNVIGSVLGVAAGLLFDISGIHIGSRSRRKRAPDRGAAFLALCWTAWLLFPLFPVIGLYAPRRKLGVFLHAAWFDPMSIIAYAAGFFAGTLLTARAGVRLPNAWLWVTALAVPAQILIAGRQPTPAELLGAIVGVALFIAFGRPAGPTRTQAILFLSVLVLRGLEPFHFSAETSGFDWIPFEATLNGDWQAAAAILIEKIFFYGTAIWMLSAASASLWRSVSAVAVVLAAIEIIQMRLPGRTAEITDPMLAILIGYTLSMLSRPRAAAKSA